MTYGARIPHDRRVVAKLWSDFHYQIGRHLLTGTSSDVDPAAVGNPFGMVDLDSLEYCQRCRKQIAILELKHASENIKNWTQTRSLGRAANLPAYLVVVHTEPDGTLTGFQVYDGPKVDINAPLVSPHAMAVWITKLHRPHAEQSCSAMRKHLEVIDEIRAGAGRPSHA